MSCIFCKRNIKWYNLDAYRHQCVNSCDVNSNANEIFSLSLSRADHVTLKKICMEKIITFITGLDNNISFLLLEKCIISQPITVFGRMWLKTWTGNGPINMQLAFQTIVNQESNWQSVAFHSVGIFELIIFNTSENTKRTYLLKEQILVLTIL